MSTNAHNFPAQIPIPIDPRIPARTGGSRTKSGRILVVSPSRNASSDIPKVGLSAICLSYRTQSGERLLALDHINLQVKAGEFLCIVGPSGCGKSTLLHLIAGLHRQTSGQVLIDGHPVQGPGTDRILIFQELGLFPWLTVGDNVEFGMKMKGVGKAERGSAWLWRGLLPQSLTFC
jgi:ABC-type multidrug transport system fused ATPase/permease subunit